MSDVKHSCPNCGYRDTAVTAFTAPSPATVDSNPPVETVTATVDGRTLEIPVDALSKPHIGNPANPAVTGTPDTEAHD